MNPELAEQMRINKRKREEEHLRALQRKMRWVVRDMDGRDNVDETEEFRAKLTRHELNGFRATENGIEAFERLLHLAETEAGAQINEIAKFLAAAWGLSELHLDVIKGLSEEIGADMIAVLDAIRWDRVGISAMAIDARNRVPAVLKLWGLWPKD